MTFIRQLKCQDCGNSFSWEHPKRNDPTPSNLECPYCAGKPPPMLKFRGAPYVRTGSRSNIVQSVDGMYKQFEEGSVARMEDAAEKFGGSPSDYSALKITNMRDDNKVGEPSVMMPSNPVTQQMETLKHNPNYKGSVGFTSNPYGGGVPGGTGENVGMMVELTNNHSQTKSATVAANRLNRD